MVATTLDAAYLAFDPAQPLRGPLLRDYYVDREGNPTARMRAILLRNPAALDKLLFTGHGGCGKSTELNRLLADPAIQQTFLVVQFSLEDILDPFDLRHLDLLIAIEASIYRVGRAAGAPFDPRALQLMADFWTPEGRKIGFIPPERSDPEGRLDAFFGILIGEFGKLKLEATSRESLRQALAARVSDLVTHIAWLSAGVKTGLGRDVLVVIDDLDKPDIADAQELFYRHPTALSQPACKAIYTISIAILYASEFRAVARNFAGWFVLPNVKTHDPQGNPYPPGLQTLRELVYRRVTPDLIEEEALEYLITMSGGVMRELTSLLQMAFNEAAVTGSSRLTRRHAGWAVAQVRNEYQRLLRRGHYEQLRQVQQDKRIREVHRLRPEDEGTPREMELLELLHNLSILEYDEEGWWDVHPIVASLL